MSFATVFFLLFPGLLSILTTQFISVDWWCKRASSAFIRAVLRFMLLIFLNLPSKLFECRSNICSILCRSLEELHIKLGCEVLALLSADLAHFFEIRLVTDEYFLDVWFGMLLNLLNPRADIVEGVFSSYVVHQNNSHCSFVVSLGDRSEALLPSGVPNLHLNLLSIDGDCFDLEVDTLEVKKRLPIVLIWEVVNWSSAKRRRKQVLPTPESPIIISFIRKSNLPCFSTILKLS